MRPLKPGEKPDAVVIVQHGGAASVWVLDPNEGVQDAYAHFPGASIMFCGVQVHARPVEEVPMNKIRLPKMNQNLLIKDKLDRRIMRPLSLTTDYVIDDGVERYKAAKRDGWVTIPCIMRGK